MPHTIVKPEPDSASTTRSGSQLGDTTSDSHTTSSKYMAAPSNEGAGTDCSQLVDATAVSNGHHERWRASTGQYHNVLHF